MASDAHLPTAGEMLAHAEADLDEAYAALSNAEDDEHGGLVQFCNWCPLPEHPSVLHHPDGRAAHRELR